MKKQTYEDKPNKKSSKILLIVFSTILLVGIILASLYAHGGIYSDSLKIQKDGIDGHIKVRAVGYLSHYSYKFYYVSPAGWNYLLFEQTGSLFNDGCSFIGKYDSDAGVQIINDRAIIWWNDDNEGYMDYAFKPDSYGLFPWWFYMVAVIVLLWGSIVIVWLVKKKQKTKTS